MQSRDGQLGTAEVVSGNFRKTFVDTYLPTTQMHPVGRADAEANLGLCYSERPCMSEYLSSLVMCFKNPPFDLTSFDSNPQLPILNLYSAEGKRHAKRVVISYEFPSGKIQNAVEQLFNGFQDMMTQCEEAESGATPQGLTTIREEKLMYISALFQKLEWIHPFLDGQGRTDLIFLNYLLVRYGFTPVILEHPYYSSTATLEHWIEHLKQGMARWQQECAGA